MRCVTMEPLAFLASAKERNVDEVSKTQQYLGFKRGYGTERGALR